MPPKKVVSLTSMMAAPAVAVEAPPAPAEQAVPIPAAKPAPQPQAVPLGKNYKRVGLYLHPTVKREIDTIAFTHERKPHDLYLEAIDLLLKAYGRASIAELEKK